MTQQSTWKEWIKIANDIDTSEAFLYVIKDPEAKKMYAALLSAAYWHPSNKARELREPPFEGLCEVHKVCQKCPRAEKNGICWDYDGDAGNAHVGRGQKERLARLYMVAMYEYRASLTEKNAAKHVDLTRNWEKITL